MRFVEQKRSCLSVLITLAGLGLSAAHAQSPMDSKIQQLGFDFAKAAAQIANMEYNIQWQDRVGTYQVPNRASNLRFTFYSNGLAAEARDPRLADGSLRDWSVQFILNSYGPNSPISANNQPAVTLNGHRGTFSTAAIDIGYQNETNGLEQTFLIKAKPPGGLMIRMPAIPSSSIPS